MRNIKSKMAILLSALSIVLLVSILVTVSVAWFYFPTTQNVTIYTDINYEIDVDLYEYRSGLGYFVQSGLNAAQDTVVADSGVSTTFVEWGGVFYPTVPITNYYMLILTYPDSNYLNGYLEADLRMQLTSGMNGTEPNDKVLYTKIAYSIAPDANIDPASTSAITQVQSVQYIQMFLDPAPVEPPIDAPLDYMNDDHLNISLLNLNSQQYTYSTIEDTKCRLVIFLRIESDPTHIAQSIEDNNISVNALQIVTNNIYTFTCNFRSIPYKTGIIGYDRINASDYTKKGGLL
ncbi:MAG: hypothetical protein PHY13_02770 [Clostridia bacterium]|nr:hypothetical protein [Clostridia bacterium]